MTGLSEELIGKRCIFNLDCPIDYSFHWAVVAHVQKVQNHKKVGDLKFQWYVPNERCEGWARQCRLRAAVPGWSRHVHADFPNAKTLNRQCGVEGIRGGKQHEHFCLRLDGERY